MERKHGGKEFVDPLLSEKYKKYKCEECDFFTHYIPYLNKHKAGRYAASFIVIDSIINPAFYSIFSLCGCAFAHYVLSRVID